MQKEKTIEAARSFAQELFRNETSGHDFAHTQRVYEMAVALQKEEGGDLFLISLAAYLHDVDDVKLFPEEAPFAHLRSFSQKEDLSPLMKRRLENIIGEVSFKAKESQIPSTLEGKIVQDADRLDALGAVGIARAFSYGGAHGRALFDPKEPPQDFPSEAAYLAYKGTTINHFYEKLLLLSELMNTESGKRIAKERNEYMKGFLREFFAEVGFAGFPGRPL